VTGGTTGGTGTDIIGGDTGPTGGTEVTGPTGAIEPTGSTGPTGTTGATGGTSTGGGGGGGGTSTGGGTKTTGGTSTTTKTTTSGGGGGMSPGSLAATTAAAGALLSPIFGGGGTKITQKDPLSAFKEETAKEEDMQNPEQPIDQTGLDQQQGFNPYAMSGFVNPLYRATGGIIQSPMQSTMPNQEFATSTGMINETPKPVKIKQKNPLDYLQKAEGGTIEGHNPQFFSEGGLSIEHRFVKGEGDGTSDSVPAMLANGEFVIPADVVSSLGNGSNEAGASVLDEFLKTIREHKRRADAKHLPPDSKGPLSYLQQAKKNVKE
jgi:hypothetical protein